MRTSVAVMAGVLGALVAAFPGHAESVYADAYLMVGRYSSHRTTPAFSQLNPLARIVTVNLSQARVRTVGQAVQHLLHGSGYLQIYSPDQYAAALMNKPLPDVHRQLGPMPLAAALKTLVGQPYEIMVNNAQRKVCVELKKTVDPEAMTTLAKALTVDAKGSLSPMPAAAANGLTRQGKPNRSARSDVVSAGRSEGYVRR